MRTAGIGNELVLVDIAATRQFHEHAFLVGS